MNTYCVYCHTTPSNRKYVGISCDAKKRWNEGRGYSKNYIFYRAIKKYGWDNIKHEILYDGLTLEEAKDIEERLIAEWHLTDIEHGYNLVSARSGISEESHKRMSNARKGNNYCNGRVLSEESRLKISNSLKNHFADPKNRQRLHKPCPEEVKERFRHRVVSEETKAKMRSNHYDCTGAKNPSAKPIRQLTLTGETIKEYEYAKLAAEENGLDLSYIIKCCRGKAKSCGGFRWEYI